MAAIASVIAIVGHAAPPAALAVHRDPGSRSSRPSSRGGAQRRRARPRAATASSPRRTTARRAASTSGTSPGRPAAPRRLGGPRIHRRAVPRAVPEHARLFRERSDADVDAARGRGRGVRSRHAVYPESIKGLYAMLCSFAPAPHTSARAYDGARLPCRSIAGQARARRRLRDGPLPLRPLRLPRDGPRRARSRRRRPRRREIDRRQARVELRHGRHVHGARRARAVRRARPGRAPLRHVHADLRAPPLRVAGRRTAALR